MRQLSRPSESDHLLPKADDTCFLKQCLLNHICLPSKAAILILLWTLVVGTTYSIILGFAVTIITSQSSNLSVYASIPFAVLALITIFYPLSGFIADTCCGRLKTIVASLCLLLLCFILYCLGGVVFLASGGENLNMVVIVLAVISLVLFIMGMIGYQANFIQLGLDQLFEARSHFLGLFVHYAVWIFHLGAVPAAIALPLELCHRFSGRVTTVYYSIPVFLILSLIALLCVSCWKYNWFYTTPSQSNPYKTVFRILNFIRKNKYPLQRSAFTYDDEYIPSRFDFAKERFGGPFTTEQVENVKTFLRILLILFMLEPVFVLEVPASHFVFPFFSLHTLHFLNFQHQRLLCTSEGIWELLVGNGTVMILSSTLLLFPLYIWINFSLLHNNLPKIFTQLGVGVMICILGVASLLLTDVVGHILLNEHGIIINHTQCMFQMIKHLKLSYPSLNMHWAVLLLPSFFLGIGPMLVITTTLEFISAQSPQSMKGFLLESSLPSEVSFNSSTPSL